MRVGIITFHRADNYGALLQCYALYNVLKEKEVKVEIIDYRKKIIEDQYRIVPRPRKNIFKWIQDFGSKLLPARFFFYEIRKKEKFKMAREKMDFSETLSKKDITQNGLNYDLIISGSDQVLNPKITNGFDDIYFLNFPGNFKKATYAASIGNIEYLEKQKIEFSNLIRKIDSISIRERDATNYLQTLTEKIVYQVLDPTLLISKKKWMRIISKSEIKIPNNYIFLYYVENNCEFIKMAEYLAERYNCPIIYFDKRAKFNKKAIYYGDSGPFEFVKLIANADVVLTSSFHATAFSCIFEKEIYIVPHSETGSRIKSLAHIFGIEDRIINDYVELKNKQNREIHYSKAEYYQQYQKSMKFLESLLRSEEASE